MTWARLDDKFPEHTKVAALSDRAFRVHVEAICYAARNLTDGHISAAAVRRIAGNSRKCVQELTGGGVWDKNGDGGYLIHDYLDYNPTREYVEEERERKRRAGRAGAKKRWHKP